MLALLSAASALLMPDTARTSTPMSRRAVLFTALPALAASAAHAEGENEAALYEFDPHNVCTVIHTMSVAAERCELTRQCMFM